MRQVSHVFKTISLWSLFSLVLWGSSLAQAQVSDGRYHIISRHSGLAMEIAGASSANGANVQQWALGGGTHQQFDVTNLGNGYFSIRPVHSGKSIDVWNFSVEPGGEIRQYDWTGSDVQQWTIESVGSGYQRIVSRHSGLALDVWEWSSDNGGDIRQWHVTTGVNQHWSFQPVSGGSAPIVEDLSHLVPAAPTPSNHNAIPSGSRTFYVAPNGNNNNAGTIGSPFATLNRAVSNAQPGDVIVMRGGVYLHDDTIRLNNVSGTANNPIRVFAYPGEQPILDFAPQGIQNNAHGVRLNANHWHLYGLTIRNAGHNGLRMDGSHNRLERLVVHNNYDTGILLGGSASHNLIMNSDSYRNFNSGVYTNRVGNNADGFGAKQLDIGPGNHFYGNRSWENSDDGFDFWRAPHTIVLQNNWTFGNGDASAFGNPSNFEGGGNGFKLGGNNDPGDHVVVRNIAFNNFGVSGNAKGFDHNNNSGALTLLNNTAFNNGRNYVFPNNPADSSKRHIFYNNLSFQGSVDITGGATQGGNSWQEGTPTSGMFQSLNTSLATSPRQADGSLPVISLLRPVAGSFLVNGGVNIGLGYSGSAPNIGAYE